MTLDEKVLIMQVYAIANIAINNKQNKVDEYWFLKKEVRDTINLLLGL